VSTGNIIQQKSTNVSVAHTAGNTASHYVQLYHSITVHLTRTDTSALQETNLNWGIQKTCAVLYILVWKPFTAVFSHSPCEGNLQPSWQNVDSLNSMCLMHYNISRSFATTLSQPKICDFSGEAFKGFEVL